MEQFIQWVRQVVDHSNAQHPTIVRLLTACIIAGASPAAWHIIEQGAPIDGRSQSGNTLLHKTALLCDVETTRLLIQRGANVNARNNFLRTPLIYAACAGCPQIAQVLVEGGADIEARDRTGQTALSVAARKGMMRYTQVLLARGASHQAALAALGGNALEQASETIQDARARLTATHDASSSSTDTYSLSSHSSTGQASPVSRTLPLLRH